LLTAGDAPRRKADKERARKGRSAEGPVGDKGKDRRAAATQESISYGRGETRVRTYCNNYLENEHKAIRL
jgi:hypothetical protein